MSDLEACELKKSSKTLMMNTYTVLFHGVYPHIVHPISTNYFSLSTFSSKQMSCHHTILYDEHLSHDRKQDLVMGQLLGVWKTKTPLRAQ